MKFGPKHLLVTTALALLIAPVAAAQDSPNPFLRGRYTSVTERAQPEFNPEPIRAGSFDIVSSLTGAVETTDNVFYQATGKQDDTIVRITPAAEARSNWTSHALTAGFTARRSEYSSNGSESTTDYSLYTRGRLDVLRNFNISAGVEGGRDTEGRYEPASANQPEPAQNEYIGGYLGAQYRSDRLRLDVSVDRRENNYQSPYFDYRDVTDTSLYGRVSYAVSPDVALFLQARQTDLDYRLAAPVNRDASLLALQAGVSFELAAPFSGEFSIGTVKDDKNDPSLKDTNNLSVNALIQWFPTQLTTVTFSGNAGIADPGVQESTSAKFTRVSVRADHELLRNLLLFAQFGYGKYDFQPSLSAPPNYDRTDENLDIRTGLTFKLNKHAHLELAYRRNSRDTSGLPLNENVASNVLSASVRIFP